MIARSMFRCSAARAVVCTPRVRLHMSSRTCSADRRPLSTLRKLPVNAADLMRSGRMILVGGTAWSFMGSMAAKSLLSLEPTAFAAMVGSSGVFSFFFIGLSAVSFGSLGLWRGSMNAADLLVVERQLLTGPVTRFAEERLFSSRVPPQEGGELLKLVREGYDVVSDAVRSRGIITRAAVAVLFPSVDTVLDGVETELDVAAQEGIMVTPPALLAAVANGIIRERIAYCRDTPTYISVTAYLALFGTASSVYALIGG